MGFFNVKPPPEKCEPPPEKCKPEPVDCKPTTPPCDEKDQPTNYKTEPPDCKPTKPPCDGENSYTPDDSSDLQAALSSLPVAEAIDYAIGYLDSGDPCDTNGDWGPTTDDSFAA